MLVQVGALSALGEGDEDEQEGRAKRKVVRFHLEQQGGGQGKRPRPL